MEKTLELLRFLREEKGLQSKKIDLDLLLAIIEFIELKLDAKLILPAVGNHVCVCKESHEINKINDKWICTKCNKPLHQ